MRILRLVTVVWLVASPGLAVDGVIEINQAKAIAGGVTACDTPDFPVSICDSGSYRLTSNLDVPAGSDGIRILDENVRIDLGGMTMNGTAVCTVEPAGRWVESCTTHVGVGVRQFPTPTAFFASVANGSVHGFDICVDLWKGARVRDLAATGCRTIGVRLGEDSVAEFVSALYNGSDGLACGVGSLISNSVVAHNGRHGLTTAPSILLVGGITASGVTANANRGVGVLLDRGSMLDQFSASRNGGEGVLALDGSLISYGAIRDNGAEDNLKYALHVQGGAGYRALVITSSNGGNTASVEPGQNGVNLGNNTCQGGACP